MITICLTYVVGCVVTLGYLILFGKKVHEIDYDSPNLYSWHDDFNSNAQAYLAWSLAWFILVPIVAICLLYKGLEWIVQRLIELTDKR
jgi:ABC-type dipeptide/oligopeptide/nickel transport system permease subunit